MYRQYDSAVLEFCKIKLNGVEVPAIGPLPPQRAWARMSEILKGKDPRTNQDPTFIPLPIISIIRLPEQPNMERFRRADVTRKLKYSDDMNSCSVGESPMPYDIPYQVDIWAYNADDFFTIREAFMRKWRNQVKAIPVDHGPPLGIFNVYAKYTNGVDNSDFESEESDRALRFTFTFTVEGFLAFPTREVKTVRKTVFKAVLSNQPLTKPESTDEVTIHEHSE